MATPRENSRVLVVDDEPLVTDALRHVLATAGYEVRTTDNGRHALATCMEWRPALVITDLRMTPINGIELCQWIRGESMVPIIVVSADSAEESKVAALDCGADDYVVKPFAPDELMARVRAALRRAGPADWRESFEIGDFRIDVDGRRVYVRASEVRLTPKEFELFVYLARHPHCVIPHAQLLAAIWGNGWLDHREYLRVFMRQLRLKLEQEPSKPRYFMTEPWVGYQFNPHGSS
jgi:two-component system KDP operon response regulator KdpE